MHTQTPLGAANLVRLPHKAGAPTLALMRTLAPDLDSVEATARAFGLHPPSPDYRQWASERTEAWILAHAPVHAGPERAALLAARVKAAVQQAIAACHACRDGWAVVETARQRAHTPGQADRAQALARLGMLARVAAGRRLAAYTYCEEAEGVAAAVATARAVTGSPVRPFDRSASTRPAPEG